MPGVGGQSTHAAPFATGDDDVAGLQGAALHEHGGDRTAAAIKPRFDHCAFGRPVRIGLELSTSACSAIVSSNLSRLVFSLAETSSSSTSPPSDSTWISCCNNSVRTRSGLASGLSILLIATMIGTLAALA